MDSNFTTSGPGSKPFDTLKVFLKNFFEEVNFDDNKSMKNYPACNKILPPISVSSHPIFLKPALMLSISLASLDITV